MGEVKIKGRKMGSISNARKSLKKGGGAFIKNVGAEGMLVRFLTEPDGWFGYPEHYDETAKAYYPCIDGQCPGCEQGIRVSNRYLTNAVDVEEDKVVPLKLAKTLANQLMLSHDRYGTLMDRDYALSRSGEGFDTAYDREPMPPKKRLTAKYKLFDLQKVLLESWNQVFGGEDDDDDEGDEGDDLGTKTRGPIARKAGSATKAGSRLVPKKTLVKKKAAQKSGAATKAGSSIKKAGSKGVKRPIRRG